MYAIRSYYAEDPDLPPGRCEQSGEDLDGRGLSRPVGTQEGEAFSGEDGQVDPVERDNPVVVALDEPADRHGGRGRSGDRAHARIIVQLPRTGRDNVITSYSIHYTKLYEHGELVVGDLQRAAQTKAEFVISSDAHTPAHVGLAPRAIELARRAGIDPGLV